MSGRRRAFVLFALLAGSSPLAAQTVTIGGMLAQPRTRLLAQGSREVIAGVWAGGGLGFELGKFEFSASGLRGSLAPVSPSAAMAREGGEIRALLAFHPVHWLGLESGYAIRAFDSPAGYQRWHIPSAGARLSARLGSPALTAYLRGGLLPRVSVSGQSSARGAVGEAGLTLRSSVPVVLRVSYRIERFDFADGRAEQFDAIAALVSLRLGRR